MRNLWFDASKNSIPKICDYIAFYEQKNKWHCILIELKSKNVDNNKAEQQLEKGKQMAEYLSKICEQKIEEYRRVIFYGTKKLTKEPIKNNQGKLKNHYFKSAYNLSNTNKIIGEKYES